MSISRKEFLKKSLAVSTGFMGLSRFMKLADYSPFSEPEFVDKKWLKLPKGFHVNVISTWGDTMSDGFYVPGLADGMGSFKLGSKTIFIRNHEVTPSDAKYGAFGPDYELLSSLNKNTFYDYGNGDYPGLGGTTHIIFDEKTGRVEKEYLSLLGTNRNCAGGITPWNTWITCEEDTTPKYKNNGKYHGYAFEVPASARAPVAPTPLKAMGRFNHEAVAVDSHTGIVYQTEDRGDGLIYRFLPNSPGNLHNGGTLQALKVKGQHAFDTRNWEDTFIHVGDDIPVEWLTLDHVDGVSDDLRKRGREQGAAVFARGEGMWFGKKEVYFACTNGGKNLLGQVFKYTPSPYEGTRRENEQPGQLHLLAESNDNETLKHCDSLTVSPWGDVILCEDNNDSQIIGITPDGLKYKIGQNIYSNSELAGLCFSPSGKYLLLNIQEEGLTLAVTGPWDQLKNRV